MPKQKKVNCCPLCNLPVTGRLVYRGVWSQVCANCAWDNVPETRKVSRVEYQKWHRVYKMVYSNTRLKGKMRVSLNIPGNIDFDALLEQCPRWIRPHFFQQWEVAHGLGINWPNRSMGEWHYMKSQDPKYTLQEYIKFRHDRAAAEKENGDYLGSLD
jgi:hypothetical protein